MPLASAIAGPKVAAVVLVVIDLIFAAPLAPKAAKQVALAPVGIMLAGAAVTLPLGAWLLTAINPLALRWVIAGLAAAMLALLASGWRYGGEPRSSVSFGVGSLSGLCSGIAQIGGPPVVAYWLSGKSKAAEVRANIILFFLGSGLLSLAAYSVGGLITWQALGFAAITGPAYGLGLTGGAHCFGLASEETFRRVCLALIALSVAMSLPVWGG
jgi:uncharacterized membrane protein YfcA